MEAIELHVLSLRKDVSACFQAYSLISICCVSNYIFFIDCMRHSFMHVCFLSLEGELIPKLEPLRIGRSKLIKQNKIHLKKTIN